MDPVAKQLLNSLKCPVCKSQIDLVGWQRSQRKDKDCNFACVSMPEHYGVWFPHWDDPSKIYRDVCKVYSGSHLYEIDQRYWLGDIPVNQTNVRIFDVDPERRVLPKNHLLFSYNKILFDFRNTTEEKIINRVKTILVFQ